MLISQKKVATFLTITCVLSSFFWLLIISAGGLKKESFLYVFGLMWCPGVAALITRYIYHRNLRGLGWSWGETRYQLLSYFIPIIYVLIPYTIVWLSGLGRFTLDASTKWWMIFTLGTCISLLTALGEELGWRGFLVPEMIKLTSFTRTSLISGGIMALSTYTIH